MVLHARLAATIRNPNRAKLADIRFRRNDHAIDYSANGELPHGSCGGDEPGAGVERGLGRFRFRKNLFLNAVHLVGQSHGYNRQNGFQDNRGQRLKRSDIELTTQRYLEISSNLPGDRQRRISVVWGILNIIFGCTDN